jgi:hypothetical protein
MTDQGPKGAERTPQEQRSGAEAERRFNETVRNLLNTPHKPHKDKGDSKPSLKAEGLKRRGSDQ